MSQQAFIRIPMSYANRKGKTEILNHATQASGLSRRLFARVLNFPISMIASKNPSDYDPKYFLLAHFKILPKVGCNSHAASLNFSVCTNSYVSSERYFNLM